MALASSSFAHSSSEHVLYGTRHAATPLEQSLAWIVRSLKADGAILTRLGAERTEVMAEFESEQKPGASLASSELEPAAHHLHLYFDLNGERWHASIHRAPQKRAFSDYESRLGSQLLEPLRHTASACKELGVLRRLTSLLKHAVNGMPLGLILLDPHGVIVFANERAEMLLSAADGLIRARGRLGAVHFRDAAHLQAAISFVLQHPQDTPDTLDTAPIITVGRTKGPPLSVAITSLPESISNSDTTAAVWVVDPDVDISSAVAVTCEMYGMTGAEVRLAKQLILGRTLAQAARAIGIREPTARAYLRQIFAKLGTNKQTGLVRFVMSRLIPLNVRFVFLPR